MEEERILKGSVEDIIFQNQDNGYAVFSISSDMEEITCTGVVPQIHSGEALTLTGRFIVHPVYGKQFQVSFFEKSIPTTEEGIEKYLSSGVIKGIGKKTAKKIVDRFGRDTFYVIEEKPDRLVEIKGITYEKAAAIHNVFMEQHSLRRAMLFLQEYGVSPAYAMKIYKKYKEKTFAIVKENPYRLADEVIGIGFRTADQMAAKAGIEPTSPFRIQSGIRYVLNSWAADGHVYLPKEVLLAETSKLLGIAPEGMDVCIKELQIQGQVWQETIDGTDVVYLNSFYYAEIYCAKKLLETAQDFSGENPGDIEEKIQKAEEKLSIRLAENQREAVRQALSNGLLIITGGPGTGKTTTIHTILHLLKEEEREIVLAAPTGRAAKRMTETTGMEAQTIHRLLGINFSGEDSQRQIFDKNETNPIEADVIIIDEASMIDIMLMYHLLKAVLPGTRLILVGDVDQLPSVGPGNVLKDMIKSQRLKVVRLTEIFRQAQESAIIMNAHRINQGEAPVLNEKDKDFFFLRRAKAEDAARTVVELITKRLPNFTGKDYLKDMQVLAPMRKGVLGVTQLNRLLQEVLNPADSRKREKETRDGVFREGDKVMQVKNNYNIVWIVYDDFGRRQEEGVGVFNGDQGIIVEIMEKREKAVVLFEENKRVEYDFSQMDELELAYAITIHKSQGSEYPVVILPIHSGPPMLMSRNLLYTAVTRAKELVVIVGLQETMQKMVENNRELNRYSSLAYRITSLYDFMHWSEEEDSK